MKTKGKILAMLRALDAGREQYKKADALTEQISREMEVGELIDIGHGDAAELVDNFAAGKNKVWKSCGISRFEIKIRRTARAD
jgi:hypothetical protein